MTGDRSEPVPPEPPHPPYRVLMESLRDHAIMTLDLTGHVVTWNDGAARLKGYTKEEILGRHFSIFYPPEELAVGRPDQELNTARETGCSEVEGFRVRKDGSQFWCNETITLIREEGGEVTGFAKISRDLTERKRIEDALRESEERNRRLVDAIHDYSISMLDPTGRILTWNPGAVRIFGWQEGEIIGRTTEVLFTPEDRAAGVPAKELSVAVAEGRADDERYQLRKDGTRFWASGVTSVLRDAGGGLRGFVKIARDLTERRQMEERRERLLEQERVARWEAEKAITLKDEFLAVVSHELRTPLSAILLWARLLRDGVVTGDAQRQAMEAIQQSAVAQQQVIDDLLDVSSIISGKMRLRLREIDLPTVVRAALDTVRPMAEAKGVLIDPRVGESAGRVRGDPDRLQQVVWNLVNNAVKFSGPGSCVTVELDRVERHVRLRVIDEGQGIAAEFLPHVFERFRQGDASLTREHGGLGLGLTICKQLVELHAGTIRAESEGVGKGATFTVELPLAELREGAEGAGSPVPGGSVRAASLRHFRAEPVLAGLRILVLEDEVNTRVVVRWLLEQCGATVTATDTVAAALRAFVDGLNEGRAFDGIVSDLGMPTEDGYAFMRQVREVESARQAAAATPALALTAFARETDRARTLAAGFAAHVAKPVEPDTLVNAVAALVGRGAT